MAALVATPWFLDHLKTVTRGVGARRERTRPEPFLRIELSMPAVEHQRQTIEVLQRLDALKRLQAQTQAELDALLPAELDRALRGEL